MKRVVYSCPYVPAEWIAAYGLSPSRILPNTSSVDGLVEWREGTCLYMRAFLNTACGQADVSGIVQTTVCDQMRRGAELAMRGCTIPVFLMHIPTTWQTVAAQGLYVSEVKRLGRFLEKLGGTIPSGERLCEIMAEYDARRSLLLATRGKVGARRFSEAIASFHALGDVPGEKGTVKSRGGAPVAFLGGPMTRSALPLFDLIEESGGRVVLDGSETGERTMPRAFDRRRIGDDPLLELADAYFGSIPDAFRRPNGELYSWIKHEIDQRGVRGIVLVRHLWCDTWHGEVQRLRDWLDIPLLDVDLSGEDPVASSRTRIQAFMESLT